jgi:cysteine desulfurase NifS/selenium donor protein
MVPGASILADRRPRGYNPGATQKPGGNVKPIYLDYNATTPIDGRVVEAMLPYITDHFGNPSSAHSYGVAARKAVDQARSQVAGMLGCEVYEVVFTSGGSESNNHAIMGVARAYRHKGNHIITSAVEHPAVTEVCRQLEQEGARVTYLPVDEYGLVDPRLLEDAITPQTILISIMHANNEVGTVEPIAEIAAIARDRGIVMHTDCAQSVGKISVTVDGLGVDLLSIAGHKVYAPKGVGALYIRTGVKVDRLIHGADHEMKRRAGTENVIEIVGLGKACEIVSLELDAHSGHMKKMRDRFEERLKAALPDLRVNGHPDRRLPNTSSLSFRGLEANTILSELPDVAASAGAACHAGGVDVSSVLEAMNVPMEYAMGTVRISVGRSTTGEEIDKAADDLIAVADRLRSGESPAGEEAAAEKVKLTQYTHGLGCACKLRPQVLEQVLERLPKPLDSNVLVGADTSDDAAVYRVDDKTAIVQTVDFFTPVVDDPFQFGAIAAANSLSDIYAMGARPVFALSVVGFPSNRLPVEVLKEILSGAISKTDEAGITIIGGHTVDDNEPKFGLAVSGLADPGRIVTNRGSMPGDVLVLTKPLGTGILSTALKRGLLDGDQTARLVEVMAGLNRDAADAMQKTGVNACTDVTGFGLLGHLREMMDSSGTSAVISAGEVPLLSGALRLATSGVIPGGTVNNREYTAPAVSYEDAVPEVLRVLLNDAQTSGGLLISVPADKAGSLMALLEEKGVEGAAVIGSVESGREAGGQDAGMQDAGRPRLIRVNP